MVSQLVLVSRSKAPLHQDGVAEELEPLVYGPIADDDEAERSTVTPCHHAYTHGTPLARKSTGQPLTNKAGYSRGKGRMIGNKVSGLNAKLVPHQRRWTTWTDQKRHWTIIPT